MPMKTRRVDSVLESPVLSRYAHLASVSVSGEKENEEASAPPTVDVRSEEVPANQGPTNLSPVERLPARPAAPNPPPKRSPFWKRITLPRAQEPPAPVAQPIEPKISLEPIVARIRALEEQIAANHSDSQARLEQSEENLTRLWEMEEQLAQAELRERLAVVEANQEEIADGLHAVARNLVVLASLLGTALGASLLAGLFLL